MIKDFKKGAYVIDEYAISRQSQLLEQMGIVLGNKEPVKPESIIEQKETATSNTENDQRWIKTRA